MKFDSVKSFPKRVTVRELVSSRYPSGHRPESWDKRSEGAEVIRDEDGQTLKLWSDGQQSPPEKGWTLMLRGGDVESGYKWTLYGIQR